MNPTEASPAFLSKQHRFFQVVFLAGMLVSFWLQWGPQSSVVWDTNCVIAFTLATAQILLFGARFVAWEAGWRPALVWEGMFFAITFAICLAEFRCGVPYYRWIFWVLLGYMLVALDQPLSWIIGAVVTVLYVPMLEGWGRAGEMSFSLWFDRLYALAFPWFLGLFYRRLLDNDIERAKLIDELQAAKKQLETTREREIELATLRERERLARDFHDTLGHQLVTLTVQLEAAQRLLTVDPPRAAALLEELQKLSRASMEELRRSLDNLRAAGLGDRPLATALQTLCAEVGERLHLVVDCRVPANTAGLPPAVAEVLWRVAQEGLTNISRHAQARCAEVNLDVQPREAILRVKDDGVGLPAGSEGKPGHYGLRGLRERVEGLGGTFTLAVPPGGGTMIEARLPLIA